MKYLKQWFEQWDPGNKSCASACKYTSSNIKFDYQRSLSKSAAEPGLL